ncbi:MAG: hypothetical protein CM1200mP2_44160 [Planctomycetaceae bacterium]|nr:MAG: hypothetical protein CM1200mP2_44160 [Planctomycetaceae bacterium]
MKGTDNGPRPNTFILGRSWKALQSSVSIAENVPVWPLRSTWSSVDCWPCTEVPLPPLQLVFSGADLVARNFPLLTMVTIGVIAVVKSSLALSLGLVGALSIVRFRAAIKEPEELVYLFLCIGVGLALGAEQPLLAVAMVIVTTVFVLGIHFTTRKSRRQSLLLTITGDSQQQFNDEETGVLSVVNALVGRYTLQRLDLEQERGQMRIAISRRGDADTSKLVAALREQLPECEFSYVNLESTL